MTITEIEKAAEQYSCTDAQKKSFVEGAYWRVNSVWHYAEEQPQNGKPTLAICRSQYPIICGPNYVNWEAVTEELEITRWAYIEELIP